MMLRRLAAALAVSISYAPCALAEPARSAPSTGSAPPRAEASSPRAETSARRVEQALRVDPAPASAHGTAPLAPLALPSAALASRGEPSAVAATVARLRDQAAAEPARADEVAAALLLLDRNDEALEVLLDAGRHAPAFELLWGNLQVAEALALPVDETDANALRMRARALASLGRREEALAILGSLPAGKTDSAQQLRAIREASTLGLFDDALAMSLERVGDSSAKRAREVLSSLWPGRTFEAEAATSWLVLQGGATRADEALFRVRDILDPESRTRDASPLLADASLLLASVSACEVPRVGAGLVGIARLRGEQDAALAIARNWASSSGLPQAWTTLGDELARRSLWTEAATAFARAADLQPQEGAARWMQAAMLELAGDADAARDAFETARGVASQSCSRQRLALAMDLSGHRDASRELREQLLADEPVGSPALAHAAAQLGRSAVKRPGDAALASLESSFDAARERATQAPLGLAVARVLPLVRAAQRAELGMAVASGDFDRALALAEHALEPFLSDSDATADIILGLRAAGRDSEAAELLGSVTGRLAEAAREAPDSPRLLNTQAWLAARVRDGLADAREAAERAAELAPSNAGILDTLAEVRFQQGDREGAVEAGTRAMALEPSRKYFGQQLERFRSGDPATAPPIHLD